MKLQKDTWTSNLGLTKMPERILKDILKKYNIKVTKESLSKLDTGIFHQAYDMIIDYYYNNDNDNDKILEVNLRNLQSDFLNGAKNWTQYSWGGSALCYNNQIMNHYLTEAQINLFWAEYDSDNDFSFDFLLDMQADCLAIAFYLIRKSAIKSNLK